MRSSYDKVSVVHLDAITKLYLSSKPVPKGYWYTGTALPDYRFAAPMSVCDPKAKVELSKALSPPYSQSEYESVISLLCICGTALVWVRTPLHCLSWDEDEDRQPGFVV